MFHVFGNAPIQNLREAERLSRTRKRWDPRCV